MSDNYPARQIAKQTIELPSPGPGTTRQLTVYRYGNPGARPKVYLQTALHADEIPGTLVLHHLRKILNSAAEQGDIRGEIIIVPVANPIGMTQRIQGTINGRLDINNGKNYNRHYPNLTSSVAKLIEGKLTASKDQNDTIVRNGLVQAVNELPEISESDAYRKVLLGLCTDSDICLDLHCDLESILYMYSNGHHKKMADQLSAQLGCEVHLVDSTSSHCFDGSISLVWAELAKLFPDHPIPAGCMGGTLELRGMSDVSDELAAHDATNLMQFLINQNIVNGAREPSPAAKCEATPLEAQIYIYSPKTGVVVYKKNCGDTVQKGEIVAVIVDPISPPEAARTELATDISGVVFSRATERLVGPGQIVMGIAGREIVPERVGTHLLLD